MTIVHYEIAAVTYRSSNRVDRLFIQKVYVKDGIESRHIMLDEIHLRIKGVTDVHTS